MKFKFSLFYSLAMALCSCKSLYTIDQLPAERYSVSSRSLPLIKDSINTSKKSINLLAFSDENSIRLKIEGFENKEISLNINEVRKLKLFNNTIDFDVVTIPFKARMGTSGFPTQLNATFNGALYLGLRRNVYTFSHAQIDKNKIQVSGKGFGIGAFAGVGSVTMNPFVTKETINYEYDGFVLQSGFAAIHDAKRYNFGFAIGTDFLMDNNRKNWIYQGKPWYGVLFGLNLR